MRCSFLRCASLRCALLRCLLLCCAFLRCAFPGCAFPRCALLCCTFLGVSVLRIYALRVSAALLRCSFFFHPDETPRAHLKCILRLEDSRIAANSVHPDKTEWINECCCCEHICRYQRGAFLSLNDEHSVAVLQALSPAPFLDFACCQRCQRVAFPWYALMKCMRHERGTSR